MITVLHFSETLTLGGCCRVMEHLAAGANPQEFNSLFCGYSGDSAYLKHLEQRGIRALLLSRDGERALRTLPKPWIAVLHRGGNASGFWNRWIPVLKECGASAIMERNIFGYADKVNNKHIDRICANSLNTLWHHWRHSGRPRVEDYLTHHRVLYNALDFHPSEEALSASRNVQREALGIGKDDFVLGVVTRPDASKIDAIVWALAPMLKTAIPNFTLVTRRYPEPLARMLSRVLGNRYHNLPVAHSREEMTATYAMMDAFGNFPGIGESFGMAMAEAMRSGLPVVALDMPGKKKGNSQRELIVDGSTGYLPKSPNGVAEAMRTLAQSPERRREMGKAARMRMLAEPFTLAGIIAQFEAETRFLAGQGARPKMQPSIEAMTEYLSTYPSRTADPALPSTGFTRLDLEAGVKRMYWKVGRRASRK